MTVAAMVAGVLTLGAGYVMAGPLGDYLSTRERLLSPVRGNGDPAARPQSQGLGAPDEADRTRGDRPRLGGIPGLGPKTSRAVPTATRQVLVVSGKGRDSPDATATLWSRTGGDRWRAGAAWPAHNGLRGWTPDHRLGDLRSPVGVFGLSDAGGLKPNPGTDLPYHRSPGFHTNGTGFHGEALAGTFDYVLAVDYNRVAGTSPLDAQQPMGPQRGGGIWLHVDHGGPTHGCVTLSEPQLVQLLRTLKRANRPVVVMGDSAALSA